MNVNSLPVPESEFRERLKKLQSKLVENGDQGAIVFYEYLEREGNVSYLTNHRSSFPNVMSHRGIGYGAFVVKTEGDGILVAPFGYEEDKVINVFDGITEPDLVKGLVKAVNELKLYSKKIGFAGLDIIPYEYFENLRKKLGVEKFNVYDRFLEKMRSIKSENEIKILTEAAEVADFALKAAMEEAEEGKSEKDVEIAARRAAYEKGADFVSRVRVSSGRKIVGLRWPMATQRKLSKGDIVYVDFIGFYKGYGFDVQRVKVIGEPDQEQKEFLNTALELQSWLISRLSPGKEIKLVKMSGRGFRYSPFLHGIGLEICEEPSCVIEGMTVKPEKGMVLCVEPTVASEKFGEIGLEDMILITEKGPIKLNKLNSVFW